ncbi:MAG: sulfite exporter TauE/SafE family protein [Halobacteriales archaeon]|nr:sulfite exporter TauE/SafE family protein [Halobacteriales archaeon]
MVFVSPVVAQLLPPTLSGSVGLFVFFLIGLLGGAHCLGMCGPLVSMYGDRMTTDETDAVSWHLLRQHALFNAGRTISYTLIGATMGALGGIVFEAAALTAIGDSIRAVVGMVIGMVVIVAGLGYLRRGTGVDVLTTVPVLGAAFHRVHGIVVAKVDRWVDGPGIVGLGALHGLLPCPLLYPAFLFAFGRGSPVEGGLALLALGVGTFPTLFAYGTAVGTLTPETSSRVHRLLGAVFVVLGTIPLTKGLRLVGVPAPSIPLPMPPVLLVTWLPG